MRIRERFNPRAPCGARPETPTLSKRITNISTHAPLAGRDYRLLRLPHCQVISTHAPLAGRDTASAFSPPPSKHFNPRAPCGARQGIKAMGSWIKEFQPTRPLRGATSYGRCCGGFLPISTHAPLAGRDHCGGGVQPSRYRISTHAPLAGRDVLGEAAPGLSYQFQPTRPLRGATPRALVPEMQSIISTHAPLAGRDQAFLPTLNTSANISTHAPLAGRDHLL